jgi:predicted TIM-barrel fold metal-dependent hydrolase
MTSSRAAKRTVMALLALAMLAAAWSVVALCVRFAAGTSTRSPRELATGLSDDARALLEQAMKGLDPAALVDYHVHVFGVGAGGTGCRASEKLFSIRHPWYRLQFAIYARAAHVRDLADADAEFVDRLTDLVSAMPIPGRHCLLAFDAHYGREGDEDGVRDDERTQLYVPNEYVMRLAREHPSLYAPVVSVHPYRHDALEELDRCAAQGARIVKWLPNAMGIDPADARCDAFYARLKKWNMTLLAHTGDEHAVDASAQALGNPLRLRRALDAGVKVIFAHCAACGVGSDLDDPEHRRVDNFDLFLRVMGEKRYEALAFGEISAVTQLNRPARVLATLLGRTDLHPRLVNGSDYPLPAINVLFSTRMLQAEGFISRDERSLLNEIYEYNPLLFDLVLKRTVRHPETGAKFPASVFLAKPALGP